MSEQSAYTFGKRERLVSRKMMERLFGGGGSRSLSAYPLRLVYLRMERVESDVPAQVLVSVPKRHLKHAVDRNRVKRQVREAYRHNKQAITDALDATPDKMIVMAFVWQADTLHDSKDVAGSVKSLIMRLAERLEQRKNDNPCHTVEQP
ncbi:MAG: ribonuclease P protein component [Prevotella sp.]|nr:ribonuclease P protein component [Prevotella sp.]